MCEDSHKQTFASWDMNKRKFDFNSIQAKSFYLFFFYSLFIVDVKYLQ